VSEGNGSIAKLPEGWKWVRIGDLAMGDIQTGPFGAQLHRSEFVSSGVPVLAIGNVKWGYVDLKEVDHVTPEKAKQLQRYVLRTNDVLFTRSGTVGRSAVLPEEADGYLMTGHILRIRLNPEIYLPELLFRAFRGEPTMERQLQRHTRGMTRAGFNTSLLSSLVVPVPPPAEQQRIVAKIEALQERSRRAREALSEVGPLLEQFRQSVLAAAFRGDLTADWRAAHPHVEPASALLRRIRAERRHRWEQAELAKYAAKGQQPPKNWQEKYQEPEPIDGSDLPELPEGWCWARWDEVGFCQNGRAFPSQSYAPNGVKLLRPGNLHVSGKVVWTPDNTRYMPLEWESEHPTYVIGADEIIMNLTAQSLKDEFLGRVCLTDNDERCLLNQRLARITPVLLSSDFCLILFKSPMFRHYVDTLNTGSLIQHMFTSQVYEFAFPLPPHDEQLEIIAAVKNSLKLKDSVEVLVAHSCQEFEQLDQAILAKAFRGELVPQNPSDEPALVLLERIRAQRAQQAETAKRQKKTSTPQRGNKTGKKSSSPTPQQMTLAEVLIDKGQARAQNS
jgi:type I restriction enzyme S subunit